MHQNNSRKMFTKAIVRRPCKNMVNGITSVNFGKPDYCLALEQHKDYVEALKECGLAVTVLPEDENYPDSTFVEDTALLTGNCAIISNPGAVSRKGEVDSIASVLKDFYTNIEKIAAPGTVEPGDIMMVGNHFFIGLSERTNLEGADQMIAILMNHGMSAAKVEMSEMLHLKTGLSYLENNTLVAYGEFVTKPEFHNFTLIEVDKDESYAANCIWINGTVVVPKGYPKIHARIKNAGYLTREVDVSEFRKLDGGLSCLSLRF